MHELEIIEFAILGALAPLTGEGVRVIEAYAGQLDEKVSMAALRFPFIYVGVMEIRVEAVNQADGLTADIRLWAGGRNVRGTGAAARGAAGGEPGIWDILEAARSRLNGLPVIGGWSAVEWRMEKPLIFGARNSVAVYEANYKTRRKTKRS